jgi:polyferredoxin
MFKVIKPEAKDNFKKMTPRKVLALWLILSIVLYIVVPKFIDLKEYKDDHILFGMIILSFLIMTFIVIVAKLRNKNS